MIPRRQWQLPTQPITGPKRREKMRQVVIHYEGVVRDTTPADIQRHLRNMQNSYLASRGYSLGYGLAVVSDARHPDDGTAWEIRGHDLNMASNPGRKVDGNANNWTGSILLIGPTGVNASEKAAARVRTLVTEWHAQAGTEPLRPVPHHFYDWTSCCGAPYEADINAGRFDPLSAPEPPEPGPPPAELIYAGIDWNGTNYNTEDWIIPASGGGLVLQPDLSVRTASIRNDVVIVGPSNSYMRPQTNRAFTVPFEVTGQMFIHSRMDEVSLIPSGDSPHWEWRVNVLPAFVDEDNNIVTGLTLNNRWSASGQIDKKYGIPRKETYTARMNHDDQIGAWHRWRVVVPKVGTHEVYWDDILVYRGVEEDPPDGPASWWSQPIKVALRFDFYDVSLRFDPLPQQPVTPPEGAPEMFFFVVANDPSSSVPETWLLCDGTQLSHVVDGHGAAVYTSAGTGVVRSTGADQTDGLIKSCKTMNDCPPEWKGTGWETLWNSRK